MQNRFRVEVRPDRGRTIVAPKGEIDLATVGQVADAVSRLRAEGTRAIVLDLRGVRFMDSTGVSMLLRAHEEASRDGFSFAVIPGGRAVTRVLELTGVAERLELAEPDA